MKEIYPTGRFKAKLTGVRVARASCNKAVNVGLSIALSLVIIVNYLIVFHSWML